MTHDQTELTRSPQLRVGFNGGRKRTFTMDTGSTGIVTSPDILTPPAGELPSGPGTLTYSSSGRVLSGQFYITEVQIGTGAASATAKVPVLLVEQETCLPNARNCRPVSPPTHLAMFGVGFGQEAAGQPYGGTNKNPFLNIVEISGRAVTPSPGYMLTAQGVTLGLSPVVEKGFRLVPLTWNKTSSDWDRAPLSVRASGPGFAGWTGAGTVLMDTGVGSMYLRPPLGETVPTIRLGSAVGPCIKYKPCPAPGVTIQVSIGKGEPLYSFTVGPDGVPVAGEKAAPQSVTVVHPNSTGAFVNTSFHFLNRFDYLYDFKSGAVGFRPRAPQSASLRPGR